MELEQKLAEIEALSIPEKGKEIKSLISESYRLAQRSVIEAYYAGCLLRSVKSDLEHGNFRVWLKNNGINRETARRFMKLADFQMTQIVSFTTVDAALKSLPKPAAKPEPVDAEVVESKLTAAEKWLLKEDSLVQQARDAEQRAFQAEEKLQEAERKVQHLQQGEKVAAGFHQGVSVIGNQQEEIRQLKRKLHEKELLEREFRKELASYKRWASRKFKEYEKQIELLKEGEM